MCRKFYSTSQCFCFHPYHAVTTTTLKYNSKPGVVTSISSRLLLFRVSLAILRLLCVHIKFNIFSLPVNNCIGILMSIVLSL